MKSLLQFATCLVLACLLLVCVSAAHKCDCTLARETEVDTLHKEAMAISEQRDARCARHYQ